MPGASLEALTGRLGVGAIALLGLFLIVDGAQLGAFEMIELYGKSATWGIVGVLPTAVVTYIVGVFCVGAAELLMTPFAAFRGPEPQDILAVSRAGGPVVQQLLAIARSVGQLTRRAAREFTCQRRLLGHAPSRSGCSHRSMRCNRRRSRATIAPIAVRHAAIELAA